MASKKYRMDMKAKIILTFIIVLIFSGCFVVGKIVYDALKPVPPPPQPEGISEKDYQQWHKISNAIVVQLEEGNLAWVVQKFSPDFIVRCQREAPSIAPICEKYQCSTERFTEMCRQLAAARGHYKNLEKQRRDRRTVFPVHLLPSNYKGPVPKDPVVEEKDYEGLDPILAQHLRLYDEKKDEIEAMIGALCVTLDS